MKRYRKTLGLVLLILSSACSEQEWAGEELSQSPGIRADLSNVRGVNYVPSDRFNSVSQWLHYDPAQVLRDMESMSAIGINAIRTWANFNVWYRDPERYVTHLTHLIRTANAHGILVVLVLFDSVGAEPSGDLEDDALNEWTWIQSPGSVALGRPSIQMEVEAYLSQTVAAIDGAIVSPSASSFAPVLLDLWNEPNHPAPFLGISFVSETIKNLTSYPITVGFAAVQDNYRYLNHVGGLDVISFHPYGNIEAMLVSEAQIAQEISEENGGLPILATEIGYHGWGMSYAHTLKWLDRLNLGFFLWEGFASRSPFRDGGGILYPSRSGNSESVVVRDLEAANSIVALALKDGFEPTRAAVLKSSELADYLEYQPAPEGFTIADLHELLIRWEELYGVSLPQVSEDAGAVLLYSKLTVWTAQSLERLGLATPELLQSLLNLSQAAQNAEAFEGALEEVVNLLSEIIISNSLSEPFNTAPDVVKINIDPLGKTIALRALVVDVDGYEDIESVRFSLENDRGEVARTIDAKRVPGQGVFEALVPDAWLEGTQMIRTAASDLSGESSSLSFHLQ